ncbi:unnamed protein product [Hymenolepis diminuta]|uniref:Uncharacterized protein n=1 Tax=Hymenolepis diminuta TaxID=6216 RepID=A0A564YG35_HYMDI|nr:unnamed protein product [Hymenolepis diminuta]
MNRAQPSNWGGTPDKCDHQLSSHSLLLRDNIILPKVSPEGEAEKLNTNNKLVVAVATVEFPECKVSVSCVVPVYVRSCTTLTTTSTPPIGIYPSAYCPYGASSDLDDSKFSNRSYTRMSVAPDAVIRDGLDWAVA